MANRWCWRISCTRRLWRTGTGSQSGRHCQSWHFALFCFFQLWLFWFYFFLRRFWNTRLYGNTRVCLFGTGVTEDSDIFNWRRRTWRNKRWWTRWGKWWRPGRLERWRTGSREWWRTWGKKAHIPLWSLLLFLRFTFSSWNLMISKNRHQFFWLWKLHWTICWYC